MRRVPFGRTAIVVQVLAAIAFLAFMSVRSGVGLPLAGGSTWEVRVAFTDAGGLRGAARAPVTVAGVPAGRVVRVEYRDGRAVATLGLDDEARGVLRADAEATVTPRSALMDLTVELTAGSGDDELRPGATIAAERTHGTVTLDQVVAQLDTDTRAHVQVALAELATGLTHRPGALRDALARLSAAVDPAAGVTRSLARRRTLLARLSQELATTFGALGEQDRALAGAITGGRRTLAVTAARRAELGATVAALPGALTRLDGALTALRRLAGPLDPALTDLRPAARRLPAALDSVAGAAPALRALVADARRLLRDGGAPLADARAALDALGPAAAELRPGLDDLRPIVAAVDAHRDGIGLLGERFSGVLSTNDANGTVLRGLGFFEPFDPANLGSPGATGARLAALKTDAVRALADTCLVENPVACVARYLVPGLPGAVRR
jgi:phospholipid/cholesterol/gamma-HCH transport system substrate-binding protein